MSSSRGIRPTSTVAFQRKEIFSEETLDLSKTDTPICDLWINVTNTTPFQVDETTGYITLPDVERVTVFGTGLSETDQQGNYKVASTAFKSDGAVMGISEAYVAEVRRKFDKLVQHTEMFDERTISETSLSGLAVHQVRETDVDFKDFETDTLLLDATYKSGISPPFIIRYSANGGEFISPTIWMHAGKFVPRKGGIDGSAYDGLVLKAKVYIIYKTFERETFKSFIVSENSSVIEQPYFAVPARDTDIQNGIKDDAAKQIALQAYLAGYDVNIDERFTFSDFFQKVIGVVKTAAPIVTAVAGVLLKDIERNQLPPQSDYSARIGLTERGKVVSSQAKSNTQARRGPVVKKRDKLRT